MKITPPEYYSTNTKRIKGILKIREISLFLGIGLIALVLTAAEPSRSADHNRQLIDSVTNKDFETVRQLLKEGANVDSRDARGRTSLLIAVAEHHLEDARLLIEAGADVNAQDNRLDSPLLLAGAEGTLEILKLILKANPDFSLYNRYGGTPLIPACKRGYVEVVRTLLNTDVDIDHVNNLGWTALLEAIVLSDGGPRHQEIVQLLVDVGANVNIGDNKGVTPLLHARQKGFGSIVNILQSAGAR